MSNNNNKNQQKKQVNFEKIPDELKVYRNWCCWRTELREGKPTKIPIDAKTGKNAESNNDGTWSTFEQCVSYYEQNLKPHFPFSEAGIGFFFSDSDPYTGIDFDDCVKGGELNETAKIQNKLVNICADIDPTYIEHTGIIKKIISGDTLRGENKYKPSFDFKSVARLWFSANEIPKSADKTEAWYRRFEIVNFPNRFTGEKRDTHLAEKLTKPETLSAVLNWAIKGLQRLEKQGEFTVSDDMIETKELYELENDSVSAFIDEMIEFPVDNAIPKTWLYERYIDYCDDTNLKGVSRRRFLQRVKAWGFEEEIKRIAVCKNHKNFRCQECISNDTKTKTARVFFGLEYRE